MKKKLLANVPIKKVSKGKVSMEGKYIKGKY